MLKFNLPFDNVIISITDLRKLHSKTKRILLSDVFHLWHEGGSGNLNIELFLLYSLQISQTVIYGELIGYTENFLS